MPRVEIGWNHQVVRGLRHRVGGQEAANLGVEAVLSLADLHETSELHLNVNKMLKSYWMKVKDGLMEFQLLNLFFQMIKIEFVNQEMMY